MTVETYIESTVTIRIPIKDATDAEEIASRCHDLRELLAFDTLHQPDRTDVEVERTKPRIVRKRASPLVVRSDDEVARGASPVETEPRPVLDHVFDPALFALDVTTLAAKLGDPVAIADLAEARTPPAGASPLDQQSKSGDVDLEKEMPDCLRRKA